MGKILRAINEANPSIEKEDLKIILPIIQKINPKVILEIGTHMGGSASLWVKAFNPELLVTIDNTEMPPNTVIEKGKNYHYLWNHDSTTDETEKAISNILYIWGRKLDFLFIDGGHTLEVVKNDVERYKKYVREGGIVGFHDVIVESDQCQVSTIWNKLKKEYDYVEIKKGKHSTGFGIIFL